MKEFLDALPVVARHPLALLAYVFVVIAWLLVALHTRKAKQLFKEIRNLSEKDRLKALELEYKTAPRAGLSAEQWLRSRKLPYWLAAYGMTLLTVVVLAGFSVHVSSGDTSSTPRKRSVTVFLNMGGNILRERFTMIYRFGDSQETGYGTDGRIDIAIPTHIEQIDEIQIDHPRFREKHVGPYKISEGTAVRVEVIDRGTPPPAAPGEMPDPLSIIPDLPSKQTVENEKPVVDPSQVVLEYKNLSDENLRLLLFDCSRYFEGKNPWKDFPFDVRDEFQMFNRFRDGTGRHCFIVRDRDGNNYYLGSENLYQKTWARLVVTGSRPNFIAAIE